jgi:hypothetical protein
MDQEMAALCRGVVQRREDLNAWKADQCSWRSGATGAGMVSTFVRGVACSSKSILMADGNGLLWAAVWEPLPGPADVVELRCYTNVAAEKQKLPRTIAAFEQRAPARPCASG